MKPPSYRAFTLTSTKGRLRELKTPCEACAAFDPAVGLHNKYEKFEAIWDTGATNSVISPDVVAKCGLKPTGMKEVHDARGKTLRETYLVNIGLLNGVAFHNVEVTVGDLGSAQLLIGMDIITQGDFSVTNLNNQTIFSFRIPSVASVDFVKDASALAKKTQRKHPRHQKKRKRPWS